MQRAIENIRPHHPMHLKGIFAVIGFALLSSAQVVYVGHLSQGLEPVVMAFWCFLLTTTFFVFLEKRLFFNRFEKVKRNWVDVIILNATTAGSWLGMFVALKYIEPAVNSAVTFAMGPIFTILFIRKFRQKSKILPAEYICAIGVLIAFSVFVWSSAAGYSAVGRLSAENTLWGFLAGGISGICVAGNTVFCKRLFDKGFIESEVMGIRFLGLMAIALLVVVTTPMELSSASQYLMPIILTSSLGILLPLYLLQVGIRNTEPVEIALLLPLAPLIVMFMQQADQRLVFSSYSLFGALTFCVFAFSGVIARSLNNGAAR